MVSFLALSLDTLVHIRYSLLRYYSDYSFNVFLVIISGQSSKYMPACM